MATAPATTNPAFKFGSGSFTGTQLTGLYDNAMKMGKSEADYAKFIADQASEFGASADEVAAVGNFYNPKGGYTASGVDSWVDNNTPQYDTNKSGVIAPAKYDFGAGANKSSISGTEVRDGYLAKLQGGQTNTNIGSDILDKAVGNGGNVTQIASALRSINPNIQPGQIAEFISQNKLPYVVNADGTISRAGAGSAPGTTPTAGGGTVADVGGSAGSGTNVDNTGTPTLGFNLNNIKAAEQWTVDPQTQTVAGQLERVLANDSPLMLQARTRALQQQAANGRLNSTMAASAGDAAMYDAALQIATPDAAMYGENARFNTGERNNFSRDANQFTRDGVMADFNVRANEWAANKNQGRTLARDAVLQDYVKQNKATDEEIQSRRDATLQAYGLANKATDAEIQTRRDELLNGYNVGTAATAAEVQAARDAVLNGYTTARDAQGHIYNLAEIAAQPDRTPIDYGERNRAWEVEDRTYTAGLNADNTARTTLTNLRTGFNTDIANLTAKGDMDPVVKQQTIDSLVGNYNDTVAAIAAGRGWVGSSVDTWLVKGSFSTPATTLPGNTGPKNPKSENVTVDF